MSGLAVTTFQDLITLALKNAGILGVGQTAAAEDSNDACQLLNAMIGQWQRRRYLVYHLIELVTQGTGNETYSVGPNGDFTTAIRPAAIKYAFARQNVNSNSQQIDYPIEILPARETYAQIALKSLQAFPRWAYYDASFPEGTLFVYPVIQPYFEVHIGVQEVLQSVTSLTGEMNMPGEYVEALMYNLAIRLAANYNSPINPAVPGLARAALETLRSVNAQIPRMNLPKGLTNPARYNVFGDISY